MAGQFATLTVETVVKIFDSPAQLAQAAADQALQTLRDLLARQDTVRLLAATGASQILFLEQLTASSDLDWRRVELFHLDEYISIDDRHPASFVRYLRERLIAPTGMRRYHFLDGMADPEEVIAEMSALIRTQPIDLAFAGIGENGHLAFNDPPADFETDQPYLIVDLDERCRRQQVGEGWFPSFEAVPARAISISVKQLLQAREIISVVPGKQKAMAVQACFSGRVTPLAPASALRLHPQTTVFLDRDSAALLSSPQEETLS